MVVLGNTTTTPFGLVGTGLYGCKHGLAQVLTVESRMMPPLHVPYVGELERNDVKVYLLGTGKNVLSCSSLLAYRDLDNWSAL